MSPSPVICGRRRLGFRHSFPGFGTFDASRNRLEWAGEHRAPRENDVNLTPREKDKLLISLAAMVAERRLKRGVKLNYPEAIALISDYVLEGARDGRTVAELMRDGATVLAREQVMEGVAEMIHVANTGDRPIQVGSHYHFYETNRALAFDRDKARGCRLDIPAGTAVRFEPGQTRDVRLVAYDGARRVFGFNGKINGAL